MRSPQPFVQPPSRHSRRGFTANELVIVLAIISIIAGMTIPRVNAIFRHSSVRDAAASTISVWQHAQRLAMNEPIPSDGMHYGVWIRQPAGDRPFVALIRGATATPSEANIISEGDGGLHRHYINRNVMLATRFNGAQEVYQNQDVIWYAQYGSGAPISPEAVVGHPNPSASLATPWPIGLRSQPVEYGILSLITLGAWDMVRFQTFDFNADTDAGTAFDVKVYPIGLGAFEEFAR